MVLNETAGGGTSSGIPGEAPGRTTGGIPGGAPGNRLHRTGLAAAQEIGTALLRWYEREKRDLPWRRTRNPYHIWVSEIMLQQTRVDTVIPYFERFMTQFPSVRDLAEAAEADVLKAWEGLGYYSRARNLQAAARQVVERHGGEVPREKAAVIGLKGVGPYTAGAILSIAFDQSEPAVDGNVMRVLSRVCNLDDDIARPSTRVKMEQIAAALIPDGEAASFNQALMELGALVCTPRSPSCVKCPVADYCAGRLAGREQALPVKTKAKPPKPVHRLAVMIESAAEGVNGGKRVLVRQRPDDGLLARMWELPHVEAPNKSVWSSRAAAADWLAGALAAEGLAVRPIRPVAEAEHVFTHLHWFMKVWSAELDTDAIGVLEAAASGTDAEVEPGSSRGDQPLLIAESGSSASEGLYRLQHDGLRQIRAGAPSVEAGIHQDNNHAGNDNAGTVYRWIDRRDFEQLAWPKVFRTLLAEYFG